MRVRVRSRQTEALHIASYELVAPDGGELPPFEAGAHVDVHLPGGLTRQYSLCNDPRERDRYVIAVLRDAASRGGSVALHEQVHAGDLLDIGMPKNHFELARPPGRSLLLAGGIGITPLLAMAETLAARGDPFTLHYGARSAASMAFRARIERSAWAASACFHLDDGPAAQRLDLAPLFGGPPDAAHVYVCGPQGFIDAVLAAAASAGWSDAFVHREYFGAKVAPASAEGSFDLRLARSGRQVHVAAGQSAAQALAAQGIEVPVSCEQGVCGSCLTRVLEGRCDHRDLYLTADEQARNDCFTPCVSRAKSPLLVLDL
jgi:vanillate O-demethylase ferredoxin subunit